MTSITSRQYFPPLLRSILTNPSIIKMGYQIKRNLAKIAIAFHDDELHSALKSTSMLLDLGQHAKLKGVVTNSNTMLEALAGSILKQSITLPAIPPGWSTVHDSLTIQCLHDEIDCVWQIYASLSSLNSVGLPLTPSQTSHNGQLVTLFHGDKAVAEGTIVWPHQGSLVVIDDANGNTRRINITPTRSLITLTRVLVQVHFTHFIYSASSGYLITVARQ
jgi:hypothetical protein